MNLKKNIIRILAVLILLIIVRNIIPFSKPGIKVTHNGNKVETAEWDYIWVPQNSGGNSGIFDVIPKLAKNIKATTVKGGDKIKFRFNTILKQPRKTVTLHMVNNEEIPVNKRESWKGNNYFSAPKEKGEYVYVIDGDWDRTHGATYLVKICVE